MHSTTTDRALRIDLRAAMTALAVAAAIAAPAASYPTMADPATTTVTAKPSDGGVDASQNGDGLEQPWLVGNGTPAPPEGDDSMPAPSGSSDILCQYCSYNHNEIAAIDDGR